MNRRIATVAVGMAMLAGVATLSTVMSTVVAGAEVADGVRITQHSDGREWSSADSSIFSSIFTVNYGLARDQVARDQGSAMAGQTRDW